MKMDIYPVVWAGCKVAEGILYGLVLSPFCHFFHFNEWEIFAAVLLISLIRPFKIEAVRN